MINDKSIFYAAFLFAFLSPFDNNLSAAAAPPTVEFNSCLF